MTGKIDPTKQYRCRNAMPWAYLETRKDGNIVGAFKTYDDRWETKIWTAEGHYMPPYENPLDLIEVRPRIQRKVWINVYKDDETRPNFAAGFTSRELADEYARESRTECLEITLDYEVGEGL